MSLAHVFAQIDYERRVEMRIMTWGHLAPKKNKTYRGRIVYAVGCFGSDNLNPTVIESDFGDLSSSPWFYDAIQELIGGGDAPKTKKNPFSTYDGSSYMLGGLINKQGCVYEWTGTMRNYQFTGQRRLIYDSTQDVEKIKARA